MSNIITIDDRKLINVNSADSQQINGDYLSDVNFNFRNVLYREDDILYSTIDLINAQIPCSFYNVNVNNNFFSYTVDGVNYSFSISEGNYNSATFISKFTVLFLAGEHGQTLSLSLNSLNGKLTFSVSGYTLVINTDTTLYEVLGLAQNTTYTITSSLTCPYPCNFLGVKKIKICSQSLAPLNGWDSSSLSNTTLLHTLTVNDAAYGIITYQNQMNTAVMLKNRIINNIDIQLLDENNQFIDFNGINWSMTFVLTNVRNVMTNGDVNLSSVLASSANNKPLASHHPSTNVALGQNVQSFEPQTNDLDVLLYNNEFGKPSEPQQKS